MRIGIVACEEANGARGEPVEHLLAVLDLFSRQFAKLAVRVVGRLSGGDGGRVEGQRGRRTLGRRQRRRSVGGCLGLGAFDDLATTSQQSFQLAGGHDDTEVARSADDEVARSDRRRRRRR